jgi:galactokinase
VIVEKFRALYGRAPEIVARAPGRIEFIGNHTDYNGGTVLGASIDRAVEVALARRSDGEWRFASEGRGPAVVLKARGPFKQAGAAAWVNYPLGVLASLPKFGLRVPAGFDYLADSNLPVGAGLSSSAAIELASAFAFLRATGEDAPLETLVKAARDAENHFVGVPCGVLDQGVSAFGRENHLVFIDCRGPRFETVPLPPEANFWIFNTHTRHALIDGFYAARHRECAQAAREFGVALLADVAAAKKGEAQGWKWEVKDGLLEILPADRELPPWLKRAKHVVEEIARVDEAVAALRAGDLARVGRLLNASHRSSRFLLENSTAELDFLAEALAAAPHVYGARLTGGGFGGAVMALTDSAFDDARARTVAASYEKQFGKAPDILHARTGDGASILKG